MRAPGRWSGGREATDVTDADVRRAQWSEHSGGGVRVGVGKKKAEAIYGTLHQEYEVEGAG